jgi:NAD-dependent deacetylase
MSVLDPILAARTLLIAASRVTVLTGAGISAESGIPTFRDAMTGLWARFRPEDLATPEAFERDPKLVNDWYAWRRELVLKAQPNPGHLALAELERRVPHFTLITQNVDGLHTRAGSHDVIELHGSILRTRVHTNGLERPDVVWFGEMLPQDALRRAFAAARACDVFLSVGTSTLVEPAASLPFAALEAGAAVIEINPTRTPLSDRARVWVQGAAGVALPALVDSRPGGAG